MSTETPEQPGSTPDPTLEPAPDAVETPESAPDETPDETPDVEDLPDVPAETGTEPQTPAPDEEREQLVQQAEQANQSPRERAQARREERQHQRQAAGVDPQSGEQPRRGDLPNASATQVGEKTVDLTLDQQVALRSLPTAATATDRAGVERIVVPDLNADGWTPNPVEPDPREVARVAAMQAALEAKKQERLEAMQVQS